MGIKHLFRYTDLPSLVGILRNKSLTLLDPQSWDDKNDSNFISIYKEKSGMASVLALCFTRSSETYHHWKVFSQGSSGVRITLDEDRIRESIKKIPGMQMNDVEYIKIEDLRTQNLDQNRLPFLKRWPYSHESEVRLLWESKDTNNSSFQLPFDAKCISEITLSPWLHSNLHQCVVETLKSIDGFENINVRKTTLINNSEWLKHGMNAT